MFRRMLVVERWPHAAEVLRVLLRASGGEVQWAGDLWTADAVLAGPAGPPDLVVVDTGLPDGDALTLCRAIKADYPELPVLGLAARGRGLEGAARCAGCDAVMTRPFAVDRLQRTVEGLLGTRRRSADRRGRPARRPAAPGASGPGA
jgi:DNA-binding response OmpR family regulator